MLLSSSKKLRQLGGMIETFNFLAVKLLLKNPRALGLFPGIMYRNYMQLAKKEHWSCKDIFEVLPYSSDRRIVLEHLPGEGIYTPPEELVYLALVTRAAQPEQIFEIGTFRGRTALTFALNSPPGCKIWTLDLPSEGRSHLEQTMNAADALIVEKSETGVDYRGKDVAHKINQLYGDSQSFDFSPYFGKMDIVFVDGAHHFPAVVSDTENALKLVKPGGYVLWHDFANYGDYNDVTRAVLKALPGDKVVQIANTQLALYRA